MCWPGIIMLIMVGSTAPIDYDTSISCTLITKLMRISGAIKIIYGSPTMIIISYTNLDASSVRFIITNNNQIIRKEKSTYRLQIAISCWISMISICRLAIMSFNFLQAEASGNLTGQ